MAFQTFRVSSFLAARQLRRANPWTTALIVAVMTLTFLNLVVISGILVGLIEGAVVAVQSYYLGDIFISNLKDRDYIESTPAIIAAAKNLPGVKGVTARYIEGGTIEANYKQARARFYDKIEDVGTSFAGIDPTEENVVTNLKSRIIEGEYLEKNDFDQVLLGSMLLSQYLDLDSADFPLLDGVGIGSRIRVKIGKVTREVRVKGIVKSKVDNIDRRVFFTDSQFRTIIGRNDFNADEIAIRLEPKIDPISIKESLLAQGFGKVAKIQTQEDAEPKFIKDTKQTFALLGAVIGSIGLVVAAITIFIIIFINAVTRRKYIGILKGIGIKGSVIELSYVMQAIAYAAAGSLIGVALVYGFLVPYFAAHPINFPFSDGILVAPLNSTLQRVLILFIATLIAGYIPARLVVKQNTLDAILGR